MMFDNVSRATELENEIRHMWGRWQQLETLRDKHRRNLDHRSGKITQTSMDDLQEQIKEYQVKWQAETGKRWRLEYYQLPPADNVMEKAFAALADQLEAQEAELLQEAVDVLTVWEYIKENGGGITRPSVIVFPVDEATEVKRFEQFENGRTNANVTAAAAWVRKQEGDDA